MTAIDGRTTLEHTTLEGKTALITGGVRRIGAAIAHILHDAGMNLALHYRSSVADAERLRDELNQRRSESVILLQGNLLDTSRLPALVEQAANRWQRLDLLVNNASSFYPTPVSTATEAQWDELMGSNLKAPFFLSQAAATHLRAVCGSIINIVDIHAERPMSKHTLYCAAKAGLVMLTKSLARELGPEIRVNGIAPGAILWPEAGVSETLQSYILSRVALRRLGQPEHIARTLLFLVRDGGYITGQIIAVDGGRSLSM
jgi:pteridine reductase